MIGTLPFKGFIHRSPLAFLFFSFFSLLFFLSPVSFCLLLACSSIHQANTAKFVFPIQVLRICHDYVLVGKALRYPTDLLVRLAHNRDYKLTRRESTCTCLTEVVDPYVVRTTMFLAQVLSA